jgi:hypothetical protein
MVLSEPEQIAFGVLIKKGLYQGAKFLVARSPLATKYFSLAIGIWPIFSKLDLCEKKWGPNSLVWLLDSYLKFRALHYILCCVCGTVKH